jgi:hypothetical protein
MKLAEICRLSPTALESLLAERHRIRGATTSKGRRSVPRWPFPGTIELWIPEANGEERYTLGTSLDLSVAGVGIRLDEPLQPGMALAIAIHEPEASLHGRAVVVHCTEIEDDYLIGLRFLFEES